jgi:two-component system sensor histidine kinase SenX3
MGIGQPWLTAGTSSIAGAPAAAVYGGFAAVLVLSVVLAAVLGRRSGRRQLSQRLSALGSRLGLDPPNDENNLESSLAYLEQVTGAATEAVASSSADAIRLRRSLDGLPQGMVVCDENGAVVYRNAWANALMTSRHGDALAAQAVTELLEDAWHEGSAEHTIDLYGPPRRTLTVRALLIDDGRRPLGVMAMIEDVSERRRLEEIRRDFVANVSHELKTPMGALGLLAETLVSEPDVEVAKRLAARIHTEAFRVSRIIDDLLDLSRIEWEEAPPREPVTVDLVMAEAAERVRATAEQRGIALVLVEPETPVTVFGDRRQLVSAMHALLENAVTYSYDHSTVTVTGRVVRPTPATVDTLAGEPLVAAGAGAWPTGGGGAGGGGAGGGGAGANGDGPTAEPDTAEVPLSGAAHPPGSGPGGGSSAATGSTAPGPNAPGSAGAGSAGAGSAGAGSAGAGSAAAGTTAAGPWSAPSGEDDRSGDGAGASGTGTGGEQGEGSASAEDARTLVHLSVADQGIGIPARDLDRIFERFYRVDPGRSRDTGGTGLGLSIVRHVANNHHGWVDVESREGEGSTFTLVLPAADSARPVVSRSRS